MKGMRWLATSALMGALVLAGCGGDDDDGGEASSGSAKGGISGSITTWIMDPGSPKLQEVLNGYAEDFSAKHPEAEVKIEFVPWAQAHDKFTTAIAGGKVPDVAEMGTTWTPEFADQGAFEAVPPAGSGDYVSSLVDAASSTRRLGQPGTPGRARIPQGRAEEGPRGQAPEKWTS